MAFPDDRTDSCTGFRNRIEDLLNPIDDDSKTDSISLLMAETEAESDEGWWDTSSMTCPESSPRSPPGTSAWPYRNLDPPARLARTLAAPAAGGQPRFGLLVRPDRPLPSGCSARSALAAARVCAKCGADSTPEWRYALPAVAASAAAPRTGPCGVGTLCNRCGLAWSRLVRDAADASAARRQFKLSERRPKTLIKKTA